MRALCQTEDVATSEVGQPNASAAVAGIVRERHTSDFVVVLRQADRHFGDDPAFEHSVAQVLRSSPELVAMWPTWSSDQRWTPSAFLRGNEVGWFDGACRNLTEHADAASAAADFIRRLAAWLARGEVLEVD
jgi:hypothetical protein